MHIPASLCFQSIPVPSFFLEKHVTVKRGIKKNEKENSKTHKICPQMDAKM